MFDSHWWISCRAGQQKQRMRTISHIFVYFAFSTLSQLKFYNNWGLTDSLLTVQTECTYKWGHSCLFPFLKCVSRQTEQLAAGCVGVFVCVCGCVCVCVCVYGRGGACMKRELGVNGSGLPNSLFLIFYSKCQFKTAGGRDNRYVHKSPLWSIYEVAMYIHPDLDCRYQNRVLIIYTLCTVLLTPVLVPFTAS